MPQKHKRPYQVIRNTVYLTPEDIEANERRKKWLKGEVYIHKEESESSPPLAREEPAEEVCLNWLTAPNEETCNRMKRERGLPPTGICRKECILGSGLPS